MAASRCSALLTAAPDGISAFAFLLAAFAAVLVFFTAFRAVDLPADFAISVFLGWAYERIV
jgi:hypothetical protein